MVRDLQSYRWSKDHSVRFFHRLPSANETRQRWRPRIADQGKDTEISTPIRLWLPALSMREMHQANKQAELVGVGVRIAKGMPRRSRCWPVIERGAARSGHIGRVDRGAAYSDFW